VSVLSAATAGVGKWKNDTVRLVVFLIRTRGLPWRTPPDPWLLISALCALVIALVVPFTIVGRWFDFTAPSAAVLLTVGAVTIGYLASTQALKRFATGE
jgi:P-type Mg2+ transporter